MAYQYNIPLATDQLSKSQSDIQGNFNALGVIAGNGATASSSLNGTVGFNYVYLASQAGAIPPITFPASNVALYSATNTTTGFNELYINKTVGLPSSPTVAQIPITAFGNNAITANQAAAWTYLPSGMLMIGGKVTVASGSATIVFNNTGSNGVTGFPGFNSFIMSIQATRLDATTASYSANVNSFTLTQCLVSISNFSSGTIFWMAIGY